MNSYHAMELLADDRVKERRAEADLEWLGDDVIRIGGLASSVSVDGLAATVTISGGETTDKLVVNGLAGDDTLDGSAIAASAIGLTLDGGPGNNILIQ